MARLRKILQEMLARVRAWTGPHAVAVGDDYPRSVEAALTEWNSPEDEEAFRDL